MQDALHDSQVLSAALSLQVLPSGRAVPPTEGLDHHARGFVGTGRAQTQALTSGFWRNRLLRTMMPLLLILMLTVVQASPAKPQPKIPSELEHLRNEFVKATNEYKQSLIRLKTIYEKNVVKAQEKLEHSRKLRSEDLISQVHIEESEAELKRAQAQVVEIDNQLANADAEIGRVFDDAKLNTEYKKAVAQRRKERKSRCANWTLTAYRRETAKTIEIGFRFVCR